MPVRVLSGNIFTSQCQTLVNTVNCVGVMGAGIALECRLRYPDLYERYVELCDSKQLDIGMLWLYKSEERWILNFPTKKSWKRPSREEYLHSGLSKFVGTYAEKGITSIAFPLLGADKGGIDREVSERIMLEYLGDLEIPVEIYRYDPTAADEIFRQFQIWLVNTDIEQASKLSGIRKPQVRALVDGISRGDVCQVNQLLGLEGVGITTVEKVFRVAVDKQFGKGQPATFSLFE